jgi:hypothetical protein
VVPGPPGFGGVDAQPIERELAGLRIPAFEAWSGQRLGVERGKTFLTSDVTSTRGSPKPPPDEYKSDN